VELQDNSVFLVWPERYEFIISADGHRITAYDFGKSREDDLEILLLGPVMSFALLKLGVEQIHATAVVVNDEAVAFLGESTYGKSTLAAAFIYAGFRLLTDDLLVLSLEDNRIWAQSGPQRIKLFPEAAQKVLGKYSDDIGRNSRSSKLLIPLEAAHSQLTAVPLRCIYVLNSPGLVAPRRVNLRRLSQKDACIGLLHNNYNTVLRSRDCVAKPFNLATAVASRVPVKRVRYPRNFASLPRVREAILADLGHKPPMRSTYCKGSSLEDSSIL
jgi:hypothetical protein